MDRKRKITEETFSWWRKRTQHRKNVSKPQMCYKEKPIYLSTTLARPVTSERMANLYRQPQEGRGIWLAEILAGFQEILLLSNDKPENGKIYVMYHGTTVDAAVKIIAKGFKPSSGGMLGRGVYVTRDIEKAARYPLDAKDRPYQVILKLRVNVGKVKRIDYKGHPLQKSWHDEGYDTAWVPADCGMVPSGLEEDCVYDPDRIKVVDVVKAPEHIPQYLRCLIEEYRK